jgi:hypothetical protein
LYASGQGVPQDHHEGVGWYRKAADQGDAVAQYNLGISYELGEGVSQNTRLAMAWYQKAAAQGHVNAKNRLDGLTK